MVRFALRWVLAALVVVGYVPLPASVSGLRPVASGAASCCAPRACCRAAHGAPHVCSAGGACQAPGAAAVGGPSAAAVGGPSAAAVGGSAAAVGGPKAAPLGAVLIAGGCGMPTPRVTPVNPDPTVAPRLDVAPAPWAMLVARLDSGNAAFVGPAPDPSVPPPRA